MGTISLSRTQFAAYNSLLRKDFYAFIRRCFYQVNPTSEFLPNWHLELIATKLEACHQGQITRLIVNVSPRSLKSLSASIAFPAWCLGHNPSASILCASYSQDLAEKHARDCRNVMSSVWYRNLFRTRLSPEKQAVGEFETTGKGFRLALSVGGSLTGRGGQMIIIDDPLKPEEALSDSQRRRANDWFDNTVYSRLDNKKTGCIIIIMQRLHEDDLVGHVIGKEPWDVLRLPAIAEQDEQHLIQGPRGACPVTRRVDEVLHAAREPRAVLDTIRANLGEYSFAGQYQQAPAPLGGGMIRRNGLLATLRRIAPLASIR